MTFPKTVRADSGFWSWELLRTLDRHKMAWSITVTNHAIVELTIKELIDGGAEHIPSGRYAANAAWFTCAVIAHNLARWTVTLGEHYPVNNRTLRLPTRWPWRDDFTTTLTNLRALPGPSG